MSFALLQLPRRSRALPLYRLQVLGVHLRYSAEIHWERIHFGLDNHSVHCITNGRDKFTGFVEFPGHSPGLSTVPRVLVFVRLVLDSVLFKVRIVQVLFERADKGNGCLSPYVR